MTYVYVPNKNAFPDVDWAQYGFTLTNDPAQAVVLFIGCEQVVHDTDIVKFPNLKIIASRTTNDDNIRIASKTQIVILSKDDVSDLKSTAEYTMFLMLSLCRNVRSIEDICRHGSVSYVGGCDLEDKTVGIFGHGRVGKMVDKYAKVFGMNALVHDKTEYSKSKILQESDIITLHLPAKKQFQNYIDSDEIDKMKSSAFLINTARPYMVSKDAIVSAIKNKKLAGFAMDYFHYSDDRKVDKDLLKLSQKHKNVILSPHVAGSTRDTINKSANRLVKKVADVFE